MASSVNSAFNSFNINTVNLDSGITTSGRTSRGWLLTQLCTFDSKDNSTFPYQYTDKHINFGSFSRNTKINPLDDIDLMFCFTADNATYLKSGNQYVISTTNAGPRLKGLSNSDVLSSIMVLNAFKNPLADIHQYSKADMHRQGEALTLQLQSYPWNFDIVPCFYTDTYLYLIPDGKGDWKAANPKVDSDLVTAINQDNDGKVLQLIRTLKYWNRYNSSHTIESYPFEQLVLNFVQTQAILSDYIDFSIRDFFLALSNDIHKEIPDPKGIQGDLNYLEYSDRVSISDKAFWAYQKAAEATHAETKEQDQVKAIGKWGEIFGGQFPSYA